MRLLDEHRINPGNDTITVRVMDDPGQGGANHEYECELPDGRRTQVSFQNGPINADGNGVNGLTHEVLLAILADRLRGFQKRAVFVQGECLRPDAS